MVCAAGANALSSDLYLWKRDVNFLAMLGIGAALAAGNETVWWRTDGGLAVGFHDTKDCSLLLYTPEHGISITWDRNDNEKIMVQDASLDFVDGRAPPMIVRIGGTSMAAVATTGVNDYAFGNLNQPVEDLLRSTDDITVQFVDKEVRIDVNRKKISALLDAVDQCRKRR